MKRVLFFLEFNINYFPVDIALLTSVLTKTDILEYNNGQ